MGLISTPHLCPLRPTPKHPALTVERDLSQPVPCTNGPIVAQRGCSHTQGHAGRAEMRSQASSLPSARFKWKTCRPRRCDSMMCVYSQSPDSMVGRGVTLPSSGPALPPWCLQMRMWKVLCAKRKGVSVIRQRATPASSSPTLQP